MAACLSGAIRFARRLDDGNASIPRIVAKTLSSSSGYFLQSTGTVWPASLDLLKFGISSHGMPFAIASDRDGEVSHEYCSKIQLGMRVKIVSQHWLRRGQIGQLVRFEQRGQNNWLVKFDHSFPGGGIDGDKLWLDQREFIEAWDEDLSKNPITGSGEGERDEEDGDDAFSRADLKGSPSYPAETRDDRQQ